MLIFTGYATVHTVYLALHTNLNIILLSSLFFFFCLRQVEGLSWSLETHAQPYRTAHLPTHFRQLAQGALLAAPSGQDNATV